MKKQSCACEVRGCDNSGEHAYIVFCTLHSAAPELLEALKKIAFEPLGDPEATHAEVLNSVEAIARRAIAAVDCTK